MNYHHRPMEFWLGTDTYIPNHCYYTGCPAAGVIHSPYPPPPPPPSPPPKDRCRSWCPNSEASAGVPHTWDQRCGWADCAKCDECMPPPAPPYAPDTAPAPPPPLQCGPKGTKYRGWHPVTDANGVTYNFGGDPNIDWGVLPKAWRDQGESRIHPLRYAEWFEFAGETGDDTCAAECRLVVDYPRRPAGGAINPRQYWRRYFYLTLDDCRACRLKCCRRACCDGDNDDHATWGCDVFRQKQALPGEPWWYSLEHGGIEASYDFDANYYNYMSYDDFYYQAWPLKPWDTWSWINEDQPWDNECDSAELACPRRLEEEEEKNVTAREEAKEAQEAQEAQEAHPRRQLTSDQVDTCQVLVWKFPEVATTDDCFLSFYNLEHRVPEHERRIGNEAYVCIADAFEPPPPPTPPLPPSPPPPSPPRGVIVPVRDLEAVYPVAGTTCTWPNQVVTFDNGLGACPFRCCLRTTIAGTTRARPKSILKAA